MIVLVHLHNKVKEDFTCVKSGTTTLNATGIITLAANIKCTGDTKYYRVGLVSEEDTTNGTAVIRLTEDITSLKAKGDSVSTDITTGYSNIRLTSTIS